MTTRQEVATTIFHQLGEGRFLAMTGAKHLISIEEGGKKGLQFSLPARFANNGINKIRIFLNSNDLYDIEFGKITKSKTTGYNYKVVISSEDVFCDQMKYVFTKVTGLHLSL